MLGETDLAEQRMGSEMEGRDEVICAEGEHVLCFAAVSCWRHWNSRMGEVRCWLSLEGGIMLQGRDGFDMVCPEEELRGGFFGFNNCGVMDMGSEKG